MADVKIYLPDNSEKVFDHEPTVLEVAQSIGDRLAKDTVGAQINDNKEIIDLRTPLAHGTQLKIVTLSQPEGLEVIRHSAAHILAQAVQELWPEIQVTIGPVIANGFFYDFGAKTSFTDEQLELIEKRMQEIVKRAAPIELSVLSKQEAIATFKKLGENYKVEIIEDLDVPEVSIYTQGDWFDLCRGPHVQLTSQVKSLKLLSHAGAYWRGDENKDQLQRIYGTAFSNKKELKEHLRLLEEAKKRDHRKLGKELGLFYLNPLSPGGPFFTPKGTVIYNQLQNYMREKYVEFDYQEVITPQIYDVDLYHQSGHYGNYKENMYFTKIDDRDFSVKPMNCPGHCVLYHMEHKSYRDLPYRIADFGRLHRYERSGVMHGLTRVRSFCQDDAHIFCTTDQMQTEIESFMKLLNEVYSTLGMTDYHIYFSTRPKKRMGSEENWDRAEAALENALKHMGLDFEINEGDGAFYGPKLDIMFVDALKRPWQLGTLQCDFNMPDAFNLNYTGSDNTDHRPVMLHRAILGSLERFIGVYLEHTAGRLPLWLSPVQVKILNLTDAQIPYCEELYQQLKAIGLRVELDQRSEKLGYKIREAQTQRVSYLLVVGEKEMESNTVSIRLKNGKTKLAVARSEFFEKIEKEQESRSLDESWVVE
ncbi:MAG: threonine--tRNA ligase [Bdellovibrionaceae bacterium]|jgi:threonyl-tRNA synthetase|nr:threonine--tRNA ligase [Pseudobdellovibrionaceae bacterium]